MHHPLRALAPCLLLLLGCQGDDGPLQLRVMSYNVKGLDWLAAQNPSYPVAVKTADLVQTISAHAPDLIGIQEAWQQDDGPSLAEELAAQLGMEHHFESTTTTGWLPYVQQNVLLSRYPLTDCEELDLGADPSSQEHRKLQLCRLELPGGRQLVAVNLHLFTDATRQLPALEQAQPWIAQRATGPLLWTGDFNLKPESAADAPYSWLTASFTPALRDPAVVLGHSPDAEQLYTSTAETPHQRIDYIFVNEQLTPLSYRTAREPIANTTYPDHLPVLAELELP